jgi:hypothetical protein
MVWTDLVMFGKWLQQADLILSLIAGLLSIAVLFGCAVASWLAPSEKKDCLFHREVV